MPKWQISRPFHILQLVKSIPFHIPEAWKRYPFRAEPPRIGHYREYPPPLRLRLPTQLYYISVSTFHTKCKAPGEVTQRFQLATSNAVEINMLHMFALATLLNAVNPLMLNINIHILLAILLIFLMLLVGRIWLKIKTFDHCWSFSLFSWPICLVNS